MQAEIFKSIFNQSILFLSDDWKNKHSKLLNDEHWNVIGRRIHSFSFNNEIHHNSLPTFNEEIIPDYPKHYQYFEKLKFIVDNTENERGQLIAKTIEETPLESLLIILGQRKTPATIIDENGIPPLKRQLLESCFAPFNEQICKAVRAREIQGIRSILFGAKSKVLLRKKNKQPKPLSKK